MFLAIKLREQDIDYHRILVEKDGDMKPFRFTSFPFGNACSPKVAITIAQLAAEKLSINHPEASEAIKNHTLMDDTLISRESEEELGVIRIGLESIYKSCLLYTSPSPRDKRQSRMPSSA